MEELLQNHLFLTHAIAAASSVAFATAFTYPLDTLKSLVQVGTNSSKKLRALQVLERVRALSGNPGLYSGLNWLVCGRMLGMGARFGIYQVLTAFYKDGREDNYVYVSEALVAGMVAGTFESIICSPFELIKLRTQVTSASRIQKSAPATGTKVTVPAISRLLPGYSADVKALSHAARLLSILNGKHPNLFGPLQEYHWMMTGSGRPPSVCDVRRPSTIISLEGWGALWRGLRSGIARDSVFGGVFFSTWQFLHRAMLDWKAVGMDPEPSLDEEIGPLSPLAISLAAGFSGSVAAAASHSFDTAKCRSQCIVLPKYVATERRFLQFRRPGKRFEKLTGIHPADRKLLFHGICMRMARCGIGSFMVAGGYYLGVHYLISR